MRKGKVLIMDDVWDKIIAFTVLQYIKIQPTGEMNKEWVYRTTVYFKKPRTPYLAD